MKSTMRALGAAITLILALVLSACGDDEPLPSTSTSTSATEGATGPTGSTGATGGLGASASAGGRAALTDGDPLDTISVPGAGSGLVTFQTEDGDVSCSMGENELRCDVPEHDWKADPKPPDCDFDWGDSVGVSQRGSEFLCVSDTVVDPGATRLADGESINELGYVCEYENGLLTCGYIGDGTAPSGFSVSREEIELF
ncbi:hypothetical protein HJD18_08240 [Thermoleophilia bacterium SCSIO 60948]|nr:hypothetical protein HJD18_08240 [Thermoleophilia bacterium SCSIO 60948]